MLEHLDPRFIASFRARFMAVVSVIREGRFLPRQQAYIADGILCAKVRYPSPGWRAVAFRDGNRWLITHFRKKSEVDHDSEIATAKKAQGEHAARVARSSDRDKGRPPQSEGRKPKR